MSSDYIRALQDVLAALSRRLNALGASPIGMDTVDREIARLARDEWERLRADSESPSTNRADALRQGRALEGLLGDAIETSSA